MFQLNIYVLLIITLGSFIDDVSQNMIDNLSLVKNKKTTEMS